MENVTAIRTKDPRVAGVYKMTRNKAVQSQGDLVKSAHANHGNERMKEKHMNIYGLTIVTDKKEKSLIEVHATGCRDLEGMRKWKREVNVADFHHVINPAREGGARIKAFACCAPIRMATAGRVSCSECGELVSPETLACEGCLVEDFATVCDSCGEDVVSGACVCEAD